MSFLVIDGSQGEGGGQVLRTALTLSVLTQTPIELINIRAKRSKPGLLRQHLTSVKAAQEISDAKTEGVELGATRIRFSPKEVKSGEYHFVIGTAGSTVLVAQTIFPVLALANGPSKITFEGGTHNGMSPSLCFFKASFLAVMKEMGINSEVNTTSLGFYPAGGGKWQLLIEPTERFSAVDLLVAGSEYERDQSNCSFKALMSELPDYIGQKEVATGREVLAWDSALGEVERYKTNGPGNSFQAKISGDKFTSLFEQVGEVGTSSERVAKRCVGRVKKFLKAGAAVEEHLADQLLIPMALAGGGEFTTTEPSLHTRTNINVIKQFLDIHIEVQEQSQGCWRIKVSSKNGR